MARRRRARTDPELSAVVILRPRDGRPLGEAGPITASTIETLLPDPAVVARMVAYFEQAGFVVSAPGAVDFSISGPRSLFESCFGTRLRVEGVGYAMTASVEGGERELPLTAIGPDIRDAVEAVMFGEPPAFGPGGAGP